MILIIPGDPIANARPRQGKWGMYDPQASLKKKVRQQIKKQLEELTKHDSVEIDFKASNLPYNQFYEVEVIFCMSIPKNATKAKRNMFSWNCIENDSNKDIDNLAKFLLDCGNGLLYPDDRYITNLTAKKISSDNPKTIVIMKKKKNLSDEVCGILGIFSKNEMCSLLQDLEDVYMLYDVDPKDDWVLEAVGEEDERHVRLSRTAYLLSKIAEYSDKLKQIKRRFGGFHQRCKSLVIDPIDG
jgi:Holliday junction resolvase RusA-like endonuclease